MPVNGLITSILVCLVVFFCILHTGCNQINIRDEAAATESGEPGITRLTTSQVHRGGDQSAWLTAAGTHGDPDFCSCNVILPLEREPAWSVEYTPAQFSPQGPRNIIHYDGVLVVNAFSQQIMGLDTDTGEVIFNAPVFDIKDAGSNSSFHYIRSVYFHPSGLLTGKDGLGRIYIWDIDSGYPDQRLIRPLQNDDALPYIPEGTDIFTCWDGAMHSVSLTTGLENWSSMVLDDGGGVVLSRSGNIIWYSKGKAYAFEAATGAPVWHITQADTISRIVLDDDRDKLYLVSIDEYVECRSITDGSLSWSFDYSILMDDSERSRLLSRFLEKYELDDIAPTGIELIPTSVTVTPNGVMVSAISGDVFALDLAGRLKWHLRLPSPVAHIQGYNNALIVRQVFLDPGATRNIVYWMPFCLDPPSWPKYLEADETIRQSIRFFNYLVLDPETGETLDQFEPENTPAVGPIPAYGKVIYGETYTDQTRKNRVVAYNWLDWEGT